MRTGDREAEPRAPSGGAGGRQAFARSLQIQDPSGDILESSTSKVSNDCPQVSILG